ncbi:MAG: hypothetical protein MI867_10650 [Pseudomonadales bacterium]|nr:hypothetical protein [Pseudomonadales bacterium]
MKVKYDSSGRVIYIIFGEKDFYVKADKIRNLRSAQLTKALRKHPKAIQIIYKYGYSESTIRRAEKKGKPLPEYYYISEIVSRSLGFEMTTDNLTDYTANQIELNYEYITDELEYDEAYNLREVSFRMVK